MRRPQLTHAGPQKHLNIHGDNIGNVVQFMKREYKNKFDSHSKRIASKIPGVTEIEPHVTEDKRVLLRFNDGFFKDPFFAEQMSDGTLKVFAYLLLLGRTLMRPRLSASRARKRTVS